MLEHLFVIYLLSGIFKGFFGYYGITFPVDFTIFTAFAVFIFIFVRSALIKNNKIFISFRNILVLFFTLLFWIWMIFSLTYTPSSEYSFTKTFLFGTLVITILIVLCGEINIRKFVKYFIIYNYVFIFMFLPVQYGYELGAISFEMAESVDDLYLTLGEHLGIIILILQFSEKQIFTKTLDKILFYISFILLLIIGARGPLLFAILAIILHYIINFRQFQKFKLKISSFKIILNSFIGLSILGVFVFFYNKISVLLNHSLARLLLLFGDDKGSSFNTRVDHFQKSFELIKDPFVFLKGIGIGSYMFVTEGVDIRGYPHNILLEVWVELGITGLFFFTLFLLSFVAQGRKNQFISIVVLFYILLNILKSSSLVDIRVYIAFLMLFHNQFEYKINYKLYK